MERGLKSRYCVAGIEEWVTGNEKNGFQITFLARRIAQEVPAELRQGSAKKSQPTHTRDQSDTKIRHLRESEPFERFPQSR